jgi:antitoxin component YwqK of YwqJK toxin-antitoxin module
MSAPKLTGKHHVHYHRDGSIWARGGVRAGKMHGYWEWFRKDGTIMRSGNFDRGEQTGTWTTYDGRGKVYKVTEMKPKRAKAAVKRPTPKARPNAKAKSKA